LHKRMLFHPLNCQLVDQLSVLLYFFTLTGRFSKVIALII
jgi:hypothetical protein